jgi:hypothetical protein
MLGIEWYIQVSELESHPLNFVARTFPRRVNLYTFITLELEEVDRSHGWLMHLPLPAVPGIEVLVLIGGCKIVNSR